MFTSMYVDMCICIYQGFPYGGDGESLPHQLKICLFPLAGNIPSSIPPRNIYFSFTKGSFPLLNNNFHDCNWTRTHNHLVRKRTLNHLVNHFAPVSSKEFLDIRATIECRFTLKRVRDMTRTYSHKI